MTQCRDWSRNLSTAQQQKLQQQLHHHRLIQIANAAAHGAFDIVLTTPLLALLKGAVTHRRDGYSWARPQQQFSAPAEAAGAGGGFWQRETG